MHKQRQGVALALLLTALPLSACSDNGGNNTKASSVTTVTLTSPTSSSSSSAPSQPTQPETTPANPSAEPTEQPAVTQTQTQADGVIGYTGHQGLITHIFSTRQLAAAETPNYTKPEPHFSLTEPQGGRSIAPPKWQTSGP